MKLMRKSNAMLTPLAPLLEASYTALRDSVYDSLVMQTRLKPYLDAISLSIDESGIALDFSAMEAANDVEWRRVA